MSSINFDEEPSYEEEAKYIDKFHSSENKDTVLKKSRYLVVWVFVLSLGMFHFGYAMFIMNPFLNKLCERFKCNDHHEVIYSSVVTTAVPLGAFIGSVLGGWLVKFGRRRVTLLNNILISIAIGITMTMPNIIVLIIGRFFYGISVGIFS